MDALTNANKATSPITRCGLTSMAIPEAVDAQKGVSVEYAPDPDKRWYVLRASYGREILAEQLLIQSHVYAYVPKRYAYIEVKGRCNASLPILCSPILLPGRP